MEERERDGQAMYLIADRHVLLQSSSVAHGSSLTGWAWAPLQPWGPPQLHTYSAPVTFLFSSIFKSIYIIIHRIIES